MQLPMKIEDCVGKVVTGVHFGADGVVMAFDGGGWVWLDLVESQYEDPAYLANWETGSIFDPNALGGHPEKAVVFGVATPEELQEELDKRQARKEAEEAERQEARRREYRRMKAEFGD